MIEPHSIEATFREASNPYEVVDVQRARADRPRLAVAIHALVTTPGIPALREHVLNILRREVRR